MSETKRESLLESYRRLNELARDLASTLDPGTLLDRIVGAAADLCGAQAASILLYDGKKQQLHFEATNNLEQKLMEGMIVPVKDSIAGWIVTNRQPIIISDVQSDPRHFKSVDEATQITTASILGVPMMVKDRVIGALEVINKLNGEFDQDDQDLLVALGAQAAVAIENALLFQQFDLISELVHELRTPLTSLNTAARLLQDPQVPIEMHDNLLQIILGETERLSDMTTDFLDLARLESARAQFQVQDFELLPLLDESVGLMDGEAQNRDIQIDVQVAEDLPVLRADRDKIKQVILNLLSNAIKYNRPSGMVTVSGASVKGEMVIEVRDTGSGIPSEHLPHLFEKFYRVPGVERSAHGTGLGLSICQRIIEAYDGHIEVHSQVGEGTTFRVHLPMVE